MKEPYGAHAPVPLRPGVIKCRFCAYTVPTRYANASDSARTPRDGYRRLVDHVMQQHYRQWRAISGVREISDDGRGMPAYDPPPDLPFGYHVVY